MFDANSSWLCVIVAVQDSYHSKYLVLIFEALKDILVSITLDVRLKMEALETQSIIHN